VVVVVVVVLDGHGAGQRTGEQNSLGMSHGMAAEHT